MKFIDSFLNRTTMYRLMLCALILFVAVATVFSSFGLLPFSPVSLIFSVLFLASFGWLINTLAARLIKVAPNFESIFISALILSLIVTPPESIRDIPFLFLTIVFVVVSKYLLVIKKHHLFNPAAFGVTAMMIIFGRAASWWVGNIYMLPFIIVGGLLIVRKIRRFTLVISFLVVILTTSLILGSLSGIGIVSLLNQELLHSPLFFFTFVMLTEPLTTPQTQKLRIAYGALIGFLSAPQVRFSSFSLPPEMALLTGNFVFHFLNPRFWQNFKQKT